MVATAGLARRALNAFVQSLLTALGAGNPSLSRASLPRPSVCHAGPQRRFVSRVMAAQSGARTHWRCSRCCAAPHVCCLTLKVRNPRWGKVRSLAPHDGTPPADICRGGTTLSTTTLRRARFQRRVACTRGRCVCRCGGTARGHWRGGVPLLRRPLRRVERRFAHRYARPRGVLACAGRAATSGRERGRSVWRARCPSEGHTRITQIAPLAPSHSTFGAVVADDWFACLPQPEAQRLLAAFYLHAPIHVALAALARHLNHPGPARALLARLMCADDADGALRLLEAHASAGTIGRCPSVPHALTLVCHGSDGC